MASLARGSLRRLRVDYLVDIDSRGSFESAAVTNVHAPQQVVLRDTFLEPELVEQLALTVPSSPRPAADQAQLTESLFGGLLKPFIATRSRRSC